MIKNEKLKEIVKILIVIFIIVIIALFILINFFVLLKLIVIFIAIADALFFKLIIDGRGFFSLGASGVTLIISRLIGLISGDHSIESVIYMVIYLIINIPLFLFCYKKVAKKFTFYTTLFVVTYSIMVPLIPQSWGNIIGIDKLDSLTSALIIGIVTGAISAAVLIVGGCTGGISIISTYLNVKKGKGIGIYNFIFNATILLIAYIIFNDLASIVYTLVYAFFSSLVLDKYYNRSKKILLEIVTNKKDEVCQHLLNNAFRLSYYKNK